MTAPQTTPQTSTETPDLSTDITIVATLVGISTPRPIMLGEVDLQLPVSEVKAMLTGIEGINLEDISIDDDVVVQLSTINLATTTTQNRAAIKAAEEGAETFTFNNVTLMFNPDHLIEMLPGIQIINLAYVTVKVPALMFPVAEFYTPAEPRVVGEA